MKKKPRKSPRGNPAKEGNDALADLARAAIDAFRADAKEAYGQLVKAYDGAAAVVGVFGLGSVLVSVDRGEVSVNPEGRERPKVTGRGAIYPETLVAISRGELTPIEAFHKGELMARAESGDLHKAYGFLVRFSDAAMRSKSLQVVLSDFRKAANV